MEKSQKTPDSVLLVLTQISLDVEFINDRNLLSVVLRDGYQGLRCQRQAILKAAPSGWVPAWHKEWASCLRHLLKTLSWWVSANLTQARVTREEGSQLRK